jgi:hypothetical protein
MKHLFVLLQLIIAVLADMGDESVPKVPCPFASRSDFSGQLSGSPHDFGTRKTHGHQYEDEDIIDLLTGGHSDAAKVVERSASKGQLTRSSLPYALDRDEPSNFVDSRLLKRNRGNSKAKKKKTDQANNTSRQKKKANGKRNKTKNKRQKQTNSQGKKGKKRGKRQTGLGASTTSRCFSNSTYDSIDNDIAKLKKAIKDGVTRSHFLGGIVRLAAHDFMDFDKRDRSNPMGSDGCFDEMHPTNKGLPESVWCKNCLLRRLYDERYSFLSRADFWIAAANAVIRQTSERNVLDLRDTFRWGRKDKSTCRLSANRLPEATGCKDVESAFITRMGMEWKDAVALMGAHSLGRGSVNFSGHEGTWVDTATDAQRFNKQYFEELVFNAWRPRNVGLETQDFTTGNNKRNDRMMLNTDICLVFNIDNNLQCCTKTDEWFQSGQSKCIDNTLKQCPLYSKSDSRWQATEAVVKYVGGSRGITDNEPFYSAFAVAWEKATTNGWRDGELKVLSGDCE